MPDLALLWSQILNIVRWTIFLSKVFLFLAVALAVWLWWERRQRVRIQALPVLACPVREYFGLTSAGSQKKKPPWRPERSVRIHSKAPLLLVIVL